MIENDFTINALIQQISLWEEMIDNDRLKDLASKTRDKAHRTGSMLPILAHSNSLNSISKAEDSLRAKAELFKTLSAAIDAVRNAKKLGMDVDADMKIIMPS